MTSQPLAAGSDSELLRIVETVMTEQGYYVEVLSGGIDLLLAENAYFVVAVAATNTIGDLLHFQGAAESSLTQRIDSSTVGPKKWDTYLVLLTQERSPEVDDVTRDLYAINYDTTRLRRIAHTGVDATTEAVNRALAPFVAPAVISDTGVQHNAFGAFLQELVIRGVEEDLARRAISAFEQGASLDDVL